MIRSREVWRPVPRGFRVVWRRGIPRQTEVSAAQLMFDLPVTGRTLALPGERPRGRVSEMLSLLLIAAQYLAGATAMRLRSWLKATFLPRAPHAHLIRLEAHAPADAPASAP